ncbi:signal peptidase I [soil metagenome]
MRKGKKRLITGFGSILLLVLALAVFVATNSKTVQVSGVSMLPTLHDGQRVLVSSAYWLVGPLRHEDIVVIHDTGPTGFIIKRIKYLGGEKVPFEDTPDDARLADGAFVVPVGRAFVMGDNRPQSEDSRRFGPVKLTDIIGKVVVWP